MNNDKKIIKNYINTHYFGFLMDKKTIESIIDYIISMKIINTNDKEYVSSIIDQYIFFSKKHKMYYFNTRYKRKNNDKNKKLKL